MPAILDNVTGKAKGMKSKIMDGDGLLGLGLVSKVKSRAKGLGSGKLLNR